MKRSLSCKTYAKINLSLDVTGVRDDGYHEVAMVMQAIDLYDEMRVRIFPADEHVITLKTDKYFVPTDARNTAYKAAQLIIDECGLEPDGNTNRYKEDYTGSSRPGRRKFKRCRCYNGA